MGPNPTADKNTSYFARYFSIERAKRKHFITMSEFYSKPSRRLSKREIEVEKKRFCKYYIRCNEATKNVAYNAMKQKE